MNILKVLLISLCSLTVSIENSRRKEGSFSLPLQWFNYLHNPEEEVRIAETKLCEPVCTFIMHVSAVIHTCWYIHNYSSGCLPLLGTLQPVWLTWPVNISSCGSFLWRRWRWWKVGKTHSLSSLHINTHSLTHITFFFNVCVTPTWIGGGWKNYS